MLKFHLVAATLALSPLAPASAQGPAQKPAAAPEYAPVSWLIGDWVSDEGGSKIRQSFRWGPNRSYILYSTYTAMNGRPEALHFEGILAWNSRSKAYDYVFAIEPGSGGQEKGSIIVQADGSIVREVELTRPDGQVGRFRQTFRQTSPDAALTSLMRQTKQGWEPIFPGSDRIALVRQP